MLVAPASHHSSEAGSTGTIEQIVLKPPRARLVHSAGDGFGSHLERLINVAYETHHSFSNIIETLRDLIDYLRKELERTYYPYQFSIVVGKHFEFDSSSASHFAWIEHGAMRVLVFSSTGCSYRATSTNTNDLDDDKTAFSW